MFSGDFMSTAWLWSLQQRSARRQGLGTCRVQQLSVLLRACRPVASGQSSWCTVGRMSAAACYPWSKCCRNCRKHASLMSMSPYAHSHNARTLLYLPYCDKRARSDKLWSVIDPSLTSTNCHENQLQTRACMSKRRLPWHQGVNPHELMHQPFPKPSTVLNVTYMAGPKVRSHKYDDLYHRIT